MEGKKNGYEKTSFSDNDIYFYYHRKEQVKDLLNRNNLSILEITEEFYKEKDGSITNEVFIVAKKL